MNKLLEQLQRQLNFKLKYEELPLTRKDKRTRYFIIIIEKDLQQQSIIDKIKSFISPPATHYDRLVNLKANIQTWVDKQRHLSDYSYKVIITDMSKVNPELN